MAITLLMTGTYADSSMEDGQVRVEHSEYPLPDYFMTLATYRALAEHDDGQSLIRMYDLMEAMPEGTHQIPRFVIEPDAAADVQNTLTLLDPPAEHSEYCAMPHALPVAAESVEQGFPLCGDHLALTRDWDSLVG
jgi:hypothetical protein